jgi:hypothetical protein
MREILISPECLEFLNNEGERVNKKFFQLVEVIKEVKVVHSQFVKKLVNTEFYELRIKAGNEIRIIIFTIDHANFIECTRLVCLNGFIKKSSKDYKNAISIATKLKEEYL